MIQWEGLIMAGVCMKHDVAILDGHKLCWCCELEQETAKHQEQGEEQPTEQMLPSTD